jgi:uncharacterized protein
MLLVDLNRLEREGRARIDGDLATNDPFWNGTDLTPRAPLALRLEAQQAGPDVVVRGQLTGEFERTCRRCLEPVVAGIEEDIGLLYRAGSSEAEVDEPADVLPLPRAATLDLTEPLREHVLLAVPRYVLCGEDCRGLCPRCGTNWNTAECQCAVDGEDDRWAPLRRLKMDEQEGQNGRT